MDNRIKAKKKIVCKVLIFLWLLVMMVFPDISTVVKLAILSALVVMVYEYHGCFIFSKNMGLGILLWELLFALFLVNGIVHGFEFEMTLFEIYLIRPLVLLILSPVILDEDMYRSLIKILVGLTICIGLYNVIHIFGVLGILPRIFIRSEGLVVVREGFLSIRASNQTALMFLAPFITTLFFRRREFGRSYSRWITVGFVLCMGTVLMSGRRALQVISILFLALNAWHILIFEKRKYQRRWGVWQLFVLLIATVIAFVILNQTLHISVFMVYNTIRDAFNSDARSSILRTVQIRYLISYWKQKPLLGWGLSAYVDDYIQWKLTFTGKTQTVLWSYENFYVALLFQTGLIGIGFIVVAMVFVFRRIYELYKRNCSNSIGTSTLAVFAGATGFLITGSANPMVTSLWMWFIVFGAYNFASHNVPHNEGE